MPASPHRRRVLTAIPGALLAGCLDSADTDGEPAQPPTDTDSGTSTDSGTTTASPTFAPEAELARLPEPSPLAEPLRGLVAADDRATYATEHDLDYRNGTVKVFGELAPGGTPPESLLVELVVEYEGTFVAWVEVADLVDLALQEDVRIVRRPPEPRTDS